MTCSIRVGLVVLALQLALALVFWSFDEALMRVFVVVAEYRFELAIELDFVILFEVEPEMIAFGV